MARYVLRRRTLLVSLPALTVATGTGCFGSFSMTRAMHGWIGSWESKWLSWLGFLGFVIIGAYGVTTFVDGFVLNAIEFFSGKPVIDNKHTRGTINTITAGGGDQAAGGEALVVRGDEERRILHVRYQPEGKQPIEVEIHDLDGQGLAMSASDGRLIACTASDRTFLLLQDATGLELARLHRHQVEDIARAVDEGGSLSSAMLVHLATSPGWARMASVHGRLTSQKA